MVIVIDVVSVCGVISGYVFGVVLYDVFHGGGVFVCVIAYLLGFIVIRKCPFHIKYFSVYIIFILFLREWKQSISSGN